MLFLQSAPHPALRQYISQYIYASFNSSELPSLKQTFLPYDIPAISFFIGPVSLDHSKQEVTAPIDLSFSQTVAAYYVGLITEPFNFYFQENQTIKVFMIPFKSFGFSSLFRQDLAELTDKIPDFSQLAGASETDRFYEQLLSAEDFPAQINVLNDFFLKRILHRQYQTEQIREACRRLVVSKGLERMTDLAYHTNMSLRNLERVFKERVGVTPKLFARFKRFHHALFLMSQKSHLSWDDIAYQCGYYDQAHFIKEFRAFSHHLPSDYDPHEYALYNQFILFSELTAF